MTKLYDEGVDILRALVGFDTTSRESNLALIGWVEAFLDARGVAYRRIPGPDGAKTNLAAFIGPNTGGGVMLAGHTDVVPVDGQPWTSDPWTVTQRNDRLYGRGVADMKGFLALSLASLDALDPAALTAPLIIGLTYDEEVGCLGAPHMLERWPRDIPRPDVVIVGEPTSMAVVSAHKGMRTYRVEVIGKEGHSSQRGQGVSAITQAVKLMTVIEALDAEAGRAAASEPPGLFETPGATLTVGLVEGGTATNILARRCVFSFDLRSPRDDQAQGYEDRFMAAAAALDAQLKSQSADCGVTVTRLSASPPLEHRPDSAAERFARGLTGDNGLAAVAFVAEAGLYQRDGLPTVLCGPGSIRQAHQPDEWIELSQLQAGADFLEKVIGALSKP